MKYYIFFVCLTLTYGRDITISPLKELKSHTRQGSKRSLDNVVLDGREHKTFEPIVIRANIPQAFVIPSVSSANKAELEDAIRVGPDKLDSYPAGSISNFEFQNNYPSINFGQEIPSHSIGSGIISAKSSGFDPILNFDSSFVAPLELKQIPSFNSIIPSYSPVRSKGSISIEQAKPVSQLAFTKIDDFQFGSKSPALIKGFNILDSRNKNLKKEKKLPTKPSYSIESVPEVASYHEIGPLVPSDIPSIPELIKIFESKSTHLDDSSSRIEGNATKDSEAKIEREKSDEEVSELIQARIGNSDKRKGTNNESGTLEGRTVDDDSVKNDSLISESSINKTESENLQANENTTLTSILIGELDTVLNKTDEQDSSTSSTGFRSSENLQDNENTTLTSILIDDLDKVLNKTDEIDSSTDSAGYRSFENDDIVDIVELSKLENNTDTSADHLQENLSNETIIVTPVPKLNASNFINASEILTETSEFKAIVHPSKIEENNVSFVANNANDSRADISEVVSSKIVDKVDQVSQDITINSSEINVPADQTVNKSQSESLSHQKILTKTTGTDSEVTTNTIPVKQSIVETRIAQEIESVTVTKTIETSTLQPEDSPL